MKYIYVCIYTFRIIVINRRKGGFSKIEKENWARRDGCKNRHWHRENVKQWGKKQWGGKEKGYKVGDEIERR